MSRRAVASFLLGFLLLPVLDGFLLPVAVAGGSGPAVLGFLLLGALLAAPVLLVPWVRRRPAAALAAGLALAVVPQLWLFLPGSGPVQLLLGGLAASILVLIAGRALPAAPGPSLPLVLALYLLVAAGFGLRDGLMNRPAAAAGGGAAPPDAPNVILVVLDTLRADSIGREWQGGELFPWTSAHAAGMRRFERGYATSNYTPPGHAGLFTGLYPAESGTLGHGEVRLADELDTIAELLRRHGYRTLGVNANLRVDGGLGYGQGFEVYDSGLVVEDRFWVRGLSRLASSPIWRPLGPRRAAWIRGHANLLLVQRQHRVEGDQVSARALELIDEQLSSEEALFLFVSYYDPHLPYEASAADRARLGDGVEVPELERNRLDPIAFHADLRRIAAGLEAGDPAAERQRRWVEEAYWEQCLQLDRALQKLLEGLDARGLLEGAVVLVTADHGEQLGEHAVFLHGTSLHEQQVRVPFLLAAPGVEPGVDPRPVSGVDFFPTVCRAVGLPIPDGLPGVPLQGDWDPDRVLRFEAGQRRGFLRGDRKWWLDDEDGQLIPFAAFDLGVDPAEEQNLLDSGLDWVEQGFRAPPFEPAVAGNGAGEAGLLRELGYADELEEGHH